MFFDPLSAWLVVLLTEGAIVANEKFGINASQAEYERECVLEKNKWLNSDIRRIKENNGFSSPEYIYERIKSAVDVTMKAYPFNCGRGNIVLDLDNQKYIIAILEKCAEVYEIKSPQKAKWFKNAATEARGLEKKYEEMRIKENKEREKQENKRFIWLLIGAVIVTILAKLIFS